MSRTIKGSRIKGAFDISYGSLRIVDKNGKEYRMSLEELDKVLKMHNYKAEMARKYEHLSVLK